MKSDVETRWVKVYECPFINVGQKYLNLLSNPKQEFFVQLSTRPESYTDKIKFILDHGLCYKTSVTHHDFKLENTELVAFLVEFTILDAVIFHLKFS